MGTSSIEGVRECQRIPQVVAIRGGISQDNALGSTRDVSAPGELAKDVQSRSPPSLIAQRQIHARRSVTPACDVIVDSTRCGTGAF